jgi:inner membrane protein
VDTLTQGLLGAACGQAFFARRLGRRALVWGAVGGLLPDLDMAVIPVLGPLAEFRYHRSLTHSLFFAPVVGPALGYVLWRRARRRNDEPRGTLRDWILLMIVALVTHPLLDWFTTYGTQLLWPFSRHRFALDGVAIIDPLYSVPLALALALFRVGHDPVRAQRAAALALSFTTAFLFYGVWLNGRAEAEAARQLAVASSPGAWRVDAYPTLLQPWLRRVVARADTQVQVGLLSLWAPRPVAWKGFRQPSHPAIDAARQTEDGRLFEWFTGGQNAARVTHCAAGTCVEIEDLRYGYGGEPDQGLWGVRLALGADGRPLDTGERFNRRPPPAGAVLRMLWRETFAPASARAEAPPEETGLAPGLKIRTLTPEVFVVVHEYMFPANSLVVLTGSSDVVLVDTPYTAAATRTLLDWIARRFGSRKITAVNTHFHSDRLGGNQALVEKGIPVHGSTSTVKLLQERGDKVRRLMIGWTKDEAIKAELAAAVWVPPSHTFAVESGLDLKLGGEDVRVYHPGPAHSPDNVVVYFAKKKLLFGGCMIQTGERIGNKSDADMEKWPQSIRNLQPFDAAWIIPGHGDNYSPTLLAHTLKLLEAEKQAPP